MEWYDQSAEDELEVSRASKLSAGMGNNADFYSKAGVVCPLGNYRGTVVFGRRVGSIFAVRFLG